MQEAQRLFNVVAKEVGNAALRARTARLRDFRQKQGGSLGKLNEQSYRKVRAERPCPVTRLPTPDGSFTANEQENHELTKEEWMKVF